jgi:hypothetical protein
MLFAHFSGRIFAAYKTDVACATWIITIGKVMNQRSKLFMRWHSAVILAAGVFAVAASHAFAQEIKATFVTETEVPVTSDSFTAEGKTIAIALNFAPQPGAQLTLVRNTSPGIIRGRFSNLAQGQTITLTYAGITYHFVANYYGGEGNDLVLLWTTGDELVAPTVRAKLDGQLLLALRKARGEPPFDKPTTLEPDIPISEGDRVLVDIEGAISKGLQDQITLAGGALPDNAATATVLRALVPLSQLEALASRPDVTFISPAKLSVTH